MADFFPQMIARHLDDTVVTPAGEFGNTPREDSFEEDRETIQLFHDLDHRLTTDRTALAKFEIPVREQYLVATGDTVQYGVGRRFDIDIAVALAQRAPFRSNHDSLRPVRVG